MTKWQMLRGVAPMLAWVAASHAIAQVSLRQEVKPISTKTRVIERTEAALLDQIKCQKAPQVGRAVNAMIENRLLAYVDNESGIYIFKLNVPMTFLGLKIRHISGFDVDEAFENVPGSRMLGTAPWNFYRNRGRCA